MKPDFTEEMDGQEFNRWYWMKQELVSICRKMGLSVAGSKFELRDRITAYLDGRELPQSRKERKTSHFDWVKSPLDRQTLITDNITFGPNFRAFMKGEIGSGFSCSSDFMTWVRNNPGETLASAIDQWHKLTSKKSKPSFKTQIAPHNMYNQYLRDFMAANPKASLELAKRCWQKRKQMALEKGVLKYRPEDPNLSVDE